jgi:RNA polymerase sigma-70 factor (ECF subfamily)
VNREDQGALEARIHEHLAKGELREAATVGIRGYGPQILGYLVALCRDEDTGCDVFSQFSENLWKGIGSYQGASSFKTWAYRVAWAAAQRWVRDPYRRRGRPLGTDEVSAIVAEVRSTTAIYRQTATKDRVAKLRQYLDPFEQTLLILRIDRKMSWSDAAQVLAEEGAPMDEQLLRKRFERLKERLRKLAVEHQLVGNDR